MKILVTGSSGFIGSALVRYLTANEFEVIRLIREGPADRNNIGAAALPDLGTKQVLWNPERDYIDVGTIDDIGIDAIVNLAGENVHQRWTTSSKAKIVNSRVRGTEILRNAILQLKKRRKLFISASGISYYHNICSDSSVWRAHDQNADSNSGHLVFDESSGPGSGFLSELCQQWERASTLMHETGVRTVNLRIKIVLGASGGVLQKLLPLFKLGFGGEMGEWNTVHELGLDR